MSGIDRDQPGPDPSRIDDLLLPLLAAGTTITATATAVGVNEKSVRRRMKDELFREALHSERMALRRRLSDRLLDASLEAISTLAELAGPDHRDTTRLGAAKAMLEVAVRHVSVVDLADRITELEERTGALSETSAK